MELINIITPKKTPPTSDFTVYVNGKILNRFESFTVSRSIDTVPSSFSISYGFSEGNISSNSNSNVLGLLSVGMLVEIYLEKQKVITGYIENATNSYSHGEHNLFVDGRSKTSVLVDSTTDQEQGGLLGGNIVTLADAAEFMFLDFGIGTIDKTNGETKYPLANYSSYDLTTVPFDYISQLAQYEGKLLYDDEYGRMVIDNVNMSPKSNQIKITPKLQVFEQINDHSTILGRYRNYKFVTNAFGGPAGINASVVPNVISQDKQPNQLPPAKNITIVSQAAYPTDGNVNGLVEFTQVLATYTANKNWGRGQSASGTATGYINPVTNKIWELNDIVTFDFDQSLQGNFIVFSATFYVDESGGKKTDLIFVRPEALQPEPITLSPLILGVDQANNTDTSTDTTSQKIDASDAPPANAKEVT